MSDDAKTRVRRYARLARKHTRLRDEAIRDMRAEGASLREIAAEAEMGHNTISDIVKKPSSASSS